MNCLGFTVAAALISVNRGESEISNSLPPAHTLFSFFSLASDFPEAEVDDDGLSSSLSFLLTPLELLFDLPLDTDVLSSSGFGEEKMI